MDCTKLRDFAPRMRAVVGYTPASTYAKNPVPKFTTLENLLRRAEWKGSTWTVDGDFYVVTHPAGCVARIRFQEAQKPAPAIATMHGKSIEALTDVQRTAIGVADAFAEMRAGEAVKSAPRVTPQIAPLAGSSPLGMTGQRFTMPDGTAIRTTLIQPYTPRESATAIVALPRVEQNEKRAEEIRAKLAAIDAAKRRHAEALAELEAYDRARRVKAARASTIIERAA